MARNKNQKNGNSPMQNKNPNPMQSKEGKSIKMNAAVVKEEQSKNQFVNYLEKLFYLFFTTKRFFSKVEHEKDYLSILLFYVITGVLATVIQFFMLLPTLLEIGSKSIANQFFLLIPRIVLSFAIPFVLSILIHLGILLMKGKEGFFNTFKPTTYTLSLITIYSFLYVLFSGIYSLFFPIKLDTMNNLLLKLQSNSIIISDLTPLLPQFILLALFFLVGIIHFLYAGTIGLSKFQNLGKWRAFFALVLFPIIASILTLGILIYAALQAPQSIPLI